MLMFLFLLFLTAADVPYGPHPLQRFDVYAPANAKNAPVIVMVHGGGWVIGDKASKGVAGNKRDHWVGKGYLFVSVNYRMLPGADPLEQARDVERAIDAIAEKAHLWGGDRRKLIVMGHSAGGHLVALLAARGGTKWRAAVFLDSGAFDVVDIMQRRHMALYDDAFGSDEDFWRRTSPYHALTKASVPMLAVCSTKRPISCANAERFIGKARSLGTSASVLKENLTHDEIDNSLGLKSVYTKAVDRFIDNALR